MVLSFLMVFTYFSGVSPFGKLPITRSKLFMILSFFFFIFNLMLFLIISEYDSLDRFFSSLR